MNLPEIIGMPQAMDKIPDADINMYNEQYKTLLIGIIRPAIPELGTGLETYKLNHTKGWIKFIEKFS